MTYIKGLELKLREIEAKLEAVELDIRNKMRANEDFMELINIRNNLSADLATTKSRIENFGKPGYMPNYIRFEK